MRHKRSRQARGGRRRNEIRLAARLRLAKVVYLNSEVQGAHLGRGATTRSGQTVYTSCYPPLEVVRLSPAWKAVAR